MKKFICCAVVAVFVLASSCSLSPIEKYENFINDLDAVTRLQTGIGQMKDGGMSIYVNADMETLIQDLSVLQTADQEVMQMNDRFIQTAQLLRESMNAAQEDTVLSQELCSEAEISFETTYERFLELLAKKGYMDG